MLLITELPADIFDHIAHFLPDGDLGRFLQSSRRLTVSPHILQQRKKEASWRRRGLLSVAGDGCLAGVQYLHGLGAVITKEVMHCATGRGHLAVVQFLHKENRHKSLYPLSDAMDCAASYGHLPVVQFLHSVGAPLTDYCVEFSARNGHLPVVQFLHSVGAPISRHAMGYAACNGRLAVVKFLNETYPNQVLALQSAMETAALHGRLGVVQYLNETDLNRVLDLQPAITKAVLYGESAVVRYLQNYHQVPNLRRTPLGCDS